MLPPIIAHHFGQQFAVIGLKRLAEQTAAVEGMLTQHALAPAVDGGHGCLVHPLRRQLQTAGALVPLRLGEVTAQFAQQIIALGITPKYGRGLDQARANPVAQFAGGRVGEGHHQNLRRQQGLAERGVAAMTEDQPQVERGNGEGLARTGAGFDQATAMQGKRQGQRTLSVHAASSSSACGWLSSSGW